MSKVPPPPALEPLFSLDIDAIQGAAGRIDALTQTLTRPALLERLRQQQAVADASGTRFALYLIDVDGLRSINDRHGHDVGDAVLISVAERVRAFCLREQAALPELALGRYDGDGLLLVSEPPSAAAAQSWGEQLRAAIALAPVLGTVPITVSVGLAFYRIGEGLDEVLVRSEKALYLAKQFGRDRIELAPEPAPGASSAPAARASS